MERNNTELSDLVVFQRGFDITKAQQSEGNVPIISSSGISSYHNQVKCKAPGVIIGRKGTLGKVFYSNVDYWPHDTTLWSKDFKGNNPRYVYYYLHLLNLETYDVGASNPTLNKNHIHKLKIQIHHIAIQRKIAGVLSVYDDLIENNTRRIAILEKMAEELYREWFIRFRFPGHEKVKKHKGVPEGWEIKKIEDSFDIEGGGTPDTKEKSFWNEGNIIWFTPSDITANKSMFISKSNLMISENGFRNSAAKMFPANCVMMTSRATIGEVSINTIPACTNQGFISCMPNDRVSKYQIYFWIIQNTELIDNVASGATYKEINRSEFKSLDFLICPKEIKNKFDIIVEPIGLTIQKLLVKNCLLRKTRDALLPRLINGKLDVSSLDIRFPASMIIEEGNA